MRLGKDQGCFGGAGDAKEVAARYWRCVQLGHVSSFGDTRTAGPVRNYQIFLEDDLGGKLSVVRLARTDTRSTVVVANRIVQFETPAAGRAARRSVVGSV